MTHTHPSSNASLTDFRELATAAAERYRRGGRFAHGFALGKLTRDPAFEYLLSHGLFNPGGADGATTRVLLDLGCGQGVVAALLEAAHEACMHGRWPAQWPQPARTIVHGIELMPNDVARARAALGERAVFQTGDIADTPFPAAHTVVILDVLHYLPYDAQRSVLSAVRDALPDGGRLLLRVGDADGGFGFRWSNWVDHVVTWCRGHRLPRLYCMSVTDWRALLAASGFASEARPMSQGTMFSNVLLIATRHDQPGKPA